jgi:DNA-binding transcriptional ArsR family regulator
VNPDDELFLRIADRLKALSDPSRLKILHTLENRELCVSEIRDAVGGSQANVSKHLARMRQSGLIEARREGTNVFYRVADPTAFAICRTVCDALESRAEQEHDTIVRGRAAAGGPVR